jgi:hypothetical protein
VRQLLCQAENNCQCATSAKKQPPSSKRLTFGSLDLIWRLACHDLFDSSMPEPSFQAMHSHELLREVLQKCGVKQVAAQMGLSLSMIYKWSEPVHSETGSGANNPLDRIETLLRCSGDLRLVQWICERAGGFFIKNPKAHWPHPDFLIPATNQIVQEFADLLAVIATAAGDNHISSDEAEKIRARWEELKSVTEGFVRCCEEGNFSKLKSGVLASGKK